MKVLYHHRTQSRDGQYIHIEELQQALRRRGHEVKEVSPTAGQRRPLGSESAMLSRLRRAIPAAHEVLEWGYNALSYRALARAVRQMQPDLLYERYALGSVAGVLIARRYGLPLFLEMNSPLAEERRQSPGLTFPRVARHLELFVIRSAARVFTVSEVLRARVIASGVPAERVVVAHNAVDLSRFDLALAPADAKRRLGLDGRQVIGLTGFFRDWHRADRLIRAMAGARGPLAQAHLLLVGDGDAAPALRAAAAAHGIADRVTITGVVQRDALASHIAAFDVAVQPGTPDYASPLKLFEYMAMAKAIVMPDLPNIREVVRPNVEALLFQAESDAEMANALETLLSDAPLRGRLGRAAYERLLAQGYTWERNVERIETAWRALPIRTRMGTTN